MKGNILQQRKVTALAIITFIIFLLAPGGLIFSQAAFPQGTAIQKSSDYYLRFHVLAHSNRPDDQSLKNELAKHLLQYLRMEMQNLSSREEMIAYLAGEETLFCLERISRQFLRSKGSSYPVQVSFQVRPFPPRFYGGELIPPGDYLALQVIIGEGKGENWWCLLFPPLCFSPVLAEDNSYALPEVESSARDKNEAVFPPPPRFFLIEILQEVFDFFVKKIFC